MDVKVCSITLEDSQPSMISVKRIFACTAKVEVTLHFMYMKRLHDSFSPI